MKSTFSMPATVAFRETESHRSSSRRDPAIRHAGRVSIRGKIRRVWRPRYLELVSVSAFDMSHMLTLDIKGMSNDLP